MGCDMIIRSCSFLGQQRDRTRSEAGKYKLSYQLQSQAMVLGTPDGNIIRTLPVDIDCCTKANKQYGLTTKNRANSLVRASCLHLLNNTKPHQILLEEPEVSPVTFVKENSLWCLLLD